MENGLDNSINIFSLYYGYKREYPCFWEMYIEEFKSKVAQFSNLSSNGSNKITEHLPGKFSNM